MYNYLTRARVDESVAETVIEELWRSYYEFNDRISHSVELVGTAIKPEPLPRSPPSNKLGNLGTSDNPWDDYDD